MRIVLLNIVFLLSSALLHAQMPVWRFDNITKVKGLINPWAGGLNAAQFSYGHLLANQPYLLVYDRTNAKPDIFKVITQNDGSKTYIASAELAQRLPFLSDWALLADYNHDGLADIFTWGNEGVVVYKNVSSISLTFEKLTNGLTYKLNQQSLPLFVNPKDIPSIKDLDGDGDLDILCFNYPDGDKVQFYRNMSFEQTGGPHQLIFENQSTHWGGFSEISCIAYGFIPNVHRLAGTERIMHIGGGAILPFDINGDSHLDVIVGKEGCRHVNVLINDETEAGKYWFSKLDTLFHKPFQAVMDIFPAAYTLPLGINNADVLVLSPNVETNAGYQSDFEHSIQLLQNKNSSGGVTDFQCVDSAFLQKDMIDVGEQSVPAFVDFDLDGDQDLVIGNKGSFSDKYHAGRLVLYENAGTKDTAVYQLKDQDWMGLSAKGWFNLRPQFTDIDSDGILDFIITNTFNYHMGDTDVKWAKGSLQSGFLKFSDQFTSLSLPSNISDAPVFFDMDQDGDQDVLIGKSNGSLEYWQNQGYPHIDFTRVMSDAMGFGQNPDHEFLRVLPYLNIHNEIELLAFSNALPMMHLGGWNNGATVNRIDTNLLYLQSSRKLISPSLGRFISPISLKTAHGIDIVLGTETGGLLYLRAQQDLSISTEKSLVLWPNPAKEAVNVQTRQSGRLICYDLSGKNIFQTSISANFTLLLPLQGLAKGCYFIKFESDTEIHVEKLLVD